MKKVIKIFAIVFGSLLGIFILAVLLRTVFLGNSSSQMMGDSGVSNLSFESPAVAGLPSDRMTNLKSANSSVTDSTSASSYAQTGYPVQEVNSSGGNAIDKKIIKDGNLSLKVDSVDEASGKIYEIAKRNGGEVFSTNVYQTAKSIKSGTVTVRVPVKNFEQTFAEIKKVASFVSSESTSGQDVTEQYTDLQSQLKNKQNEEVAFTKILDQNTGKIDDILAVTRELSRVRGDIERLLGRIRFMDSQTDMSTISANISEDIVVSTTTTGWRPWQVAKAEMSKLLRDLQGVMDAIIIIVVRLIPLLIVISIFGFIFWKIGRSVYGKFFQKNDAKVENQEIK
jgi:hypothetical protein